MLDEGAVRKEAVIRGHSPVSVYSLTTDKPAPEREETYQEDTTPDDVRERINAEIYKREVEIELLRSLLS